MRSILGPLVLLLLAAPLPVGIVMTGCAASLPPAVQVPDVKSIAGKWQGTQTGASVTVRLTPAP